MPFVAAAWTQTLSKSARMELVDEVTSSNEENHQNLPPATKTDVCRGGSPRIKSCTRETAKQLPHEVQSTKKHLATTAHKGTEKHPPGEHPG
eukprot:6093539-Amphidinium_carterae.2